METVQSFKGYGKVDEADEAALRKRTRRRIIIISVSLALLVAAIIGVVAGVLVHKSNSSVKFPTSPAAAIKAICGLTQYPDSCLATLSSSNLSDPEKLFQFSLTVALNALSKLSDLPEAYANKTTDPLVKGAVLACGEVIDDAVSNLNDTVSAMLASDGGGGGAPKINDLRTWLSAALTNQDTCLDALAEANASFADEVERLMTSSTELVSNSLAIVSKLLGLIGNFKIPFHRRLLLLETEVEEEESSGDDFPKWISAANRRMLQGNMAGPSLMPNVVVAKDGSGNVSTVSEAVALVPKKSLERFVIYVKAGLYEENVVVDKHHWNVVLVGDGKTKTVITSDKNFIDGTATFHTATFAVVGRGFVARNVGFVNSAGAAKHQAVAVRCGADMSVFYQCAFDAFQDTLYVHSNRQYYGQCDVTGTVDFIFGNAAVVFQNCNIMPRQPLAAQFNAITAQGRKDPNENTGISIINCNITAFGNVTAPTYLGRPWKNYSTTIIMQSTISNVVRPQGWIAWVQNVEPESTINYAEFRNRGAGASTANRVTWKGYRRTLSTAQAAKFRVEPFIQGSTFLPTANVIYDSN